MKNQRLFIYLKEMIHVTGLNKRTVIRMIKRIRKKYGLEEGAYIPIGLFCEYTFLDEEAVRTALNNPGK